MASDSRTSDQFVPEAFPPAPARILLRDIPPIDAEDTPRHAIRCFRRHQVSELPVTSLGALVGWLAEDRAAEVVLEDADRSETITVRELMMPVPAQIASEARGEELLAYFQATGNSLLPVVAPDGRYLGCVTRADALSAREGWFPPPRIGGMATPLGVYMTTGTIRGGAGDLGLFLTGIVFAAIMWAAQNVLIFAMQQLAQLTRQPLFVDLARIFGQQSFQGSGPYVLTLIILSIALSFTLFLLLLRYLPLLAGYHAAEHQTISAIEEGEPLTPDAVARMPRVHPRCGTNLVALMSLSYLGVTTVAMLLTTEIAGQNIEIIVMLAVFGILFVAANWRRVGGWIQQHLTTRPPTAKELASGIKAGRELLCRHLEAPLPPRRALRLWRMGFVQVLTGAVVTSYLLQWLLLILQQSAWLDEAWHNMVK
ncbi:MAG: DUF1385 domain-containing protein [Armatimonadota bacterium]